MAVVDFQGFAGVRLEADVLGSPDDPSVLLVHGQAQTREAWASIAAALVAAGRQVINLDLRGHGASAWPADGRYDLDALAQDLRAVLAQMGARPTVIAAASGAAAAIAALGADAAHLATGLVLADPPSAGDKAAMGRVDPRFAFALAAGESARVAALAPALKIPALVVRGRGPADPVVEQLTGAEVATIDLAGDPDEDFNAVLLDFLERRIPRAAQEYRAGSDARTLRDALGCFTTGVTIVTTTSPEGEPVGLAANSFTSVSLDPPLLLICVSKTSNSLPSLLAARHFAVNVLHIGQQPTSNRFARKDEDRFAATPWRNGETGVPLLLGSLANFECERYSETDAGDHIVLIGRVLRARFEPHRDPLLFFRAKYRRLHMA